METPDTTDNVTEPLLLIAEDNNKMAVGLLSWPFILLYIILGVVSYRYLNARPKNAPPGPIGEHRKRTLAIQLL